MLVHPQFDPVAVQIGPLAVRWYGLMYLVGFVLFVVFGRLHARRLAAAGGAAGPGARPAASAPSRWSWSARDIEDLLFFGVLGVILGGRLGYVIFYKAGHYLAHPLEIFAVWQGGMSFHGGLLGVLAAVALFARRRGRRFLEVTDFVAPLIPLGLAAGRLGNFINGELWGRPTDLPWGMVFPQADALARHPSQLYQAAGEGLALFAILWWFSARPRPLGAVSGAFLAGYGIFRFLAEFAREPDSFLGVLALGLTMGQWLSLPMIAVGAWMLARARGQR